jgi:hypothetical protein
MLFGCVAAGLGAAPRADAATHHHGHPARVQILSPADNSRPSATKVVARVRVSGHRPGFQAYLDGTDVTSRFHGGALRTAVFRNARLLGAGEHTLFVTVGHGRPGDTASSRFVARERTDRVLSVKHKARGSYTSPLFQIRSKGELLDSKVWLNGKRIDDQLDEERDYRGLHGRPLGSQLRFGKNRVKVATLTTDGRFAIYRSSFRVPRNAPIASAGRDRRVGVGTTVKLDASGSRLPTQGGHRKPKKKGGQATAQASAAESGPSYEWKLIEAPPGSEAEILKPASEKGELIPDVPGLYLATVTVTAPDGIKSTDDVEVESSGAGGPMGMPIQTITTTGGIQIGAPKQGGRYYEPRGNWVQMLVLKPSTATPIESPTQTGEPSQPSGPVPTAPPTPTSPGIPTPPGPSYQPEITYQPEGASPKNPGILNFNVGQGKDLREAVKHTATGDLVVLSGQGLNVSLGQSDQKYLKEALETLGGTVAASGTTPDGTADLGDGAWSLIGHRGLTPGYAKQNTFLTEAGIQGFLEGSAGKPGSLNGYLQAVTSEGFQYISPEVVSLDTKWTPNISTPPSPTQNTIMVGDTPYPSQNIGTGEVNGCPCSVAIQVLLLDQSTLKATLAGTFGVIATNGQTVQPGTEGLAYVLHKAIQEHGAGQSSLLILQDFGSGASGGAWPGASSHWWLQDSLPNSNEGSFWNGNTFPSKPSQLAKSWNEAIPFGTVAGDLGVLVSPGFHDVVANYRRPLYEPTSEKVVDRTWGGLTAVTSTHPFDQTSAYGSGQGTVPPSTDNPLLDNGRITGGLTRNNQGQWEMGGETQGAGYPGLVESDEPNSEVNEFDGTALPKLILAPQTPWPCSEENPEPCSSSGKEIKAAMHFIITRLPNYGNGNNVRANYLNEAVDWGIEYTSILSTKLIDCEGHTEFAFNTCNKLREVLSAEFAALGTVKEGFTDLTALFTSTETHLHGKVQQATEQVVNVVKKSSRKLPKQTTTMDAHGWIETALSVGSGVLGASIAGLPEVGVLAAAPSALSALSSLLKLSDGASTFFEPPKISSGDPVADATNLIRDRAQNLGKDLELKLTAATSTLKHFEDIARTDPFKLKEVAANFGEKWKLGTKDERRFAQALTISAVGSTYEATIPLAFNQWIVGPTFNNLNPGGAAELPSRHYVCDYESGSGEYNIPFEDEPASTSGMSSVAWGANHPGNMTNFTLRALKLKTNDMQLETETPNEDTVNDNVYVNHKGAAPPASLMDPLFEPASENDPLFEPKTFGLNKEEFFGLEGWKIRQLQCGETGG